MYKWTFRLGLTSFLEIFNFVKTATEILDEFFDLYDPRPEFVF